MSEWESPLGKREIFAAVGKGGWAGLPKSRWRLMTKEKAELPKGKEVLSGQALKKKQEEQKQHEHAKRQQDEAVRGRLCCLQSASGKHHAASYIM